MKAREATASAMPVARRLRTVARPGLVAVVMAVAFAVVVGGAVLVSPDAVTALWPPFLAAAVGVLAVRALGPRLERLPSGPRATSPDPAPAAPASGVESVDDALPGVARSLAEGTRARRASIWLVVDGRLVAVAAFPSDPPPPSSAAGLSALLARADLHHVEPILEGDELRAVLALDKSDRAVLPADRQLARDVAAGAGLLLRVVRGNAELRARVRRSDELAEELRASEQRLDVARDAERRRLVADLDRATTERLVEVRADVAAAWRAVEDPPADPAERTGAATTATEALARAVETLDDLLERFRAIVRGVYPSVLNAHGLRAALEEMVIDLPCPVRIVGDLPGRWDRELESTLYLVAVSTLSHLAAGADRPELALHLDHESRSIRMRVHDTRDEEAGGESRRDAPASLEQAVADDTDRLAALGGGVHVGRDEHGRARLEAWLPDALTPATDAIPSDVEASR